MGQPVKLSDKLVLEARLAGEDNERSIAGQIEHWARLGRAVESLLVLDATLGLASMTQARAFNDAVPMTGLALAKLDGTAKGGAVIGIEGDMRVPVKLAGVGETIEDLAAFDPAAYIRSLVED